MSAWRILLQALADPGRLIGGVRPCTTGELNMQHGKDCEKVPHTGDGHLHAEADDTPYDVDSTTYCGRCHAAIAYSCPAPPIVRNALARRLAKERKPMETDYPKSTERACMCCVWWQFMNSVTGHCKRMPPARTEEGEGRWPVTGRADWCGEFKRDGA
jgi:hypothetical protein